MYGISPEIWENEQAFKAFIRKPEDGAVFIRIDSAPLEGLKLSSLAAEYNPVIQLVWMAAREAYAIDAFSCGADAYLLLPAKEESLREVMKLLDLRQSKTK